MIFDDASHRVREQDVAKDIYPGHAFRADDAGRFADLAARKYAVVAVMNRNSPLRAGRARRYRNQEGARLAEAEIQELSIRRGEGLSNADLATAGMAIPSGYRAIRVAPA